MSFLCNYFMKTCALLSVMTSRDINRVRALGAIVQNKGQVIVCLEYIAFGGNRSGEILLLF